MNNDFTPYSVKVARQEDAVNKRKRLWRILKIQVIIAVLLWLVVLGLLCEKAWSEEATEEIRSITIEQFQEQYPVLYEKFGINILGHIVGTCYLWSGGHRYTVGGVSIWSNAGQSTTSYPDGTYALLSPECLSCRMYWQKQCLRNGSWDYSIDPGEIIVYDIYF